MVVSKQASGTNTTAAHENMTNGDEEGGVQELSRLLLEGWTMLADTCPRSNCNMPLARSRQGRIVCCNCRMDVVRAVPNPALPQLPAPTSSSSPEGTPNAGTAARTPALGGNSNAITTTTTTTPATTSTATMAATTRDRVCALLGERLLQGWTLLEDKCGCGVPLVKDVQGQTRCIACESGEGGRQMVVGGDRRELERLQNRRIGHERETGGERRRESGQGIPRLAGRDVPRLAAGGARVGANAVPGLGVGVGCVQDETDEELGLCEEAVRRKLTMLRERLERTQEVEACRVICAAMKEAMLGVKAGREARAMRGA